MRCPPVLCILLELAQVPRMLRIEGHTHRAQERAELFPLISFPKRPNGGVRGSGTLPLPHLDLALGLGTRGLPPGDSSKLHPSWDGLTQQLQRQLLGTGREPASFSESLKHSPPQLVKEET